MTKLPSVSVVVPVRNGAETLPACLASLRRLDYPADRLEVIAVDNGSTDDTALVLAAEQHWIRLESESIKGPGPASNRGVARAAGDVIAFTDADCVVDAGWLRALVTPLADDEVGIAGGVILPIEPGNAVQRFGTRIHDHQKAIEAWKPPEAIGMNWASRKAVLQTAGGFDARFRRCEDVDLAYRIQLAGYRLVYVPTATVYHRNESTLCGLFHEGFLHGLHAVHIHKVHRDFVSKFGHQSVSLRSYVDLARTLGRGMARPGRTEEVCDGVFQLGKKIGKLAGSLRHTCIDL